MIADLAGMAHEQFATPAGWAENTRWQLMHAGMPMAVPVSAYQNMARYGFRGWHGLTYGLSKPLTSRIEGWSTRTLARHPGWAPGHSALNIVTQVFSGGHGVNNEVIGLSGRPWGKFAFSRSERLNMLRALHKPGTGWQTTSARSGGMMFEGGGAANSIYRRMMMSNMPSTFLGMSENMSLRQSLGMLFRGASSEGAGLISQQAAKAAGSGVVAQNMAAKSIRSAGVGGAFRRLGFARAASLVAAPVFGVLNTVFIAKLAYDLGKTGVTVAGLGAKAIRSHMLGIPNVDFGGGDMSAFQTGLAQTERQRAVQAIQTSVYNARTAIGQEASMMHA